MLAAMHGVVWHDLRNCWQKYELESVYISVRKCSHMRSIFACQEFKLWITAGAGLDAIDTTMTVRIKYKPLVHVVLRILTPCITGCNVQASTEESTTQL